MVNSPFGTSTRITSWTPGSWHFWGAKGQARKPLRQSSPLRDLGTRQKSIKEDSTLGFLFYVDIFWLKQTLEHLKHRIEKKQKNRTSRVSSTFDPFWLSLFLFWFFGRCKWWDKVPQLTLLQFGPAVDGTSSAVLHVPLFVLHACPTGTKRHKFLLRLMGRGNYSFLASRKAP